MEWHNGEYIFFFFFAISVRLWFAFFHKKLTYITLLCKCIIFCGLLRISSVSFFLVINQIFIPVCQFQRLPLLNWSKISLSHEIPLMAEHGSECVLLIRLLLAMTTSETSQIKPDHLNPNSSQTMKMRKIRETERGRHYKDGHEHCSAFISSTSN